MEHTQAQARYTSTAQKIRQMWTPEEDRILSSAVARENPTTGTINWHKVATHLPGRNNKDCRKRWHYSIAHTIRKGTWSKDEDAKLLEAVEKYGFRWSKVAKAVGTRNGDQVFKRWGDCLDPRIDKSPWTAAEDEKLLRQIALTGHNWSEMVTKHFPNRTALSAKNRYSILLRKQNVVRQPPMTASTAPHASTMNDSSTTYIFHEMLPEQQAWTATPNNIPYTGSDSEGSPSGDMLDAAAMASPSPTAGTGLDWTIMFPDGTFAQSFAGAEYQLQAAWVPSPGVTLGEEYRAGWLMGCVDDGGQCLAGAGDPFSLYGGQNVECHNPALVCLLARDTGDTSLRYWNG